MKLYLTLVSALVLMSPRSSSAVGRSKDLESLEKCEPINIEMCKSLPYDQTLFPNHLGQKNQEEADRTIVTYSPLINIKCSPDIQLFLCSMLAPVCTVLPKPLLPCRSLCESAREGCESLMKSFGYNWPEQFECSKLPVDGGSELCMGRNSSGVDDRKLESFKTSTIIPGIPNEYEEGFVICPAQLKAPKDKDYSLAVGDVQVEDCGAPCHNMFFRQGEITQINTWSGVWAIFGMIPCLFTIATYLIDPSRFPFPQLSIIFMSFCYLVVTIVYVIGFALGDNVACGQAFQVKDINLETERLVRQGTLDDWRCQVIAMVLYFFDTAGSLWWVMLTVGWFLEAGLKWGSEAIEGSYLHAIVWTVAAIQMVLMVVLKKIEGDILSGVCFVGLWDSHSLLSFVVIPKALYLGIGFVFLIMGVVSHIRVRSEIQKRREKTDALESLLCRIGLFSFLFLLPASIEFGCYVYEFLHMDSWMASWQEHACRDPKLQELWQMPCRQPGQTYQGKDWPTMWLYFLKFGAIPVKAAFSCTWVWCRKTLDAWKRFLSRLTGDNSNIYDTPHQL